MSHIQIMSHNMNLSSAFKQYNKNVTHN